MFRTYYRAKLLFAVAVASFVGAGIGAKELAWAWNYVEVPATVLSFEQRCAGGSRGPGYIDCADAFAAASRRTLLTVSYTSPADGQVHQATVQCDTAAEDTPAYFSGQQLPVLASRKDAARIDRRKCTTVSTAA